MKMADPEHGIIWAEVIIAAICIITLVLVKECINDRFKKKMKMPVPIDLIVVSITSSLPTPSPHHLPPSPHPTSTHRRYENIAADHVTLTSLTVGGVGYRHICCCQSIGQVPSHHTWYHTCRVSYSSAPLPVLRRGITNIAMPHSDFRFPTPEPPPFYRFTELIPSAITIAIVSFAVSVSMAKIFAKKHNYEIDANQVSRAV